MRHTVVHEAYDNLALSHPHRIAAVESSSGMNASFKTICDRSRNLAMLLRERNVTGCTIASITRRNIDTLALYLAVSRLVDVSWIPLSSWEEASATGMSREKWVSQLEYCIQEGEVLYVLTDPGFESTDLQSTLQSNITMLPLPIEETPHKDTTLNRLVSSRKFPILKLLSGGTTGVPKLYPISHEMILSELDNYAHVIGSANFSSLIGQPVLQQSCLLWPASCIGQFNIALACQGTAIITSTRDTFQLASEIDRFNVRVVGGVPSQLSLLVEYITAQSMLTVFSWGEPISEPIVSRLLAKPAVAVIELLVATEYWLCMYRKWDRSDSPISLSREFSIVPSCTVSVVDPDANNVGQLSLSGPMISDSRITTNDLVRKTHSGVSFVGRLDFVTKIGGNWYDFRHVENAVVNLDLFPPVLESAALTVNKIHYLVLSVDSSDAKRCVYGDWIKKVTETVRCVCPVDLTVRIITDPLPRTPTTGKLNRKELISILSAVAKRDLPHIASDIAKVRFYDELKSHAKWTGIFALCLRQYAVLVPYMYLVLLHCPRNGAGYLPRSRKQSAVVTWSSRIYDLVSRSFPFGRAGFLILLSVLASRKKSVRRFMYVWTLAGVVLALKGKRALSWPVTFWVSIGGDVRGECEPWLTESKWKYFLRDLKFLFLSIPDSFTDTQFSESGNRIERKVSETPSGGPESNHPPEQTSRELTTPELPSMPTTRGNSIDDDEEDDREEEKKSPGRRPSSPVVQDSAVNEWWAKSPVEYIGVVHNDSLVPEESSVLSPPIRSPPLLEGESDSIENFLIDCVSRVVNPDMRPVSESTALLSLSSLQVTELVQRLRLRIPRVSARDIMESPAVGDLIVKLKEIAACEKKSLEATSNIATPRLARIQFSPGQIGRVCRWMIKSKEGFDKDRLGKAIEGLVSRHPLLRAEIVEPKSFLSFIYDGAVLVVNARRFFASHPASSAIMPWLDLITDCVYDSWLRTVIHAPNSLPSHWDETLVKWPVRVNDYDDFRRKIMNHKKGLEDSWYLRQNPINVIVYSMKEYEYLLLSVKHSYSDGNSAFPLIDELAELYEGVNDLGPIELVDAVPELEKRFKDGLFVVPSNPDRVSVRTNMFYSREVDEAGGGYYRHYLCFEPSMISVLRRLASDTLNVGFDSLLLSLLVMSLLRTDNRDTETITLYCPLRDGPGESGLIGLLADWRDLTIQVMPGASLVDVVNDIAHRVRTRDWTPTLSPANPESLLLNWLAFDGTRRRKIWEPFNLDNITTKWNKMDTRDFDFYATPSGRFRSMSLEQYNKNGQWWLRFDVAMSLYPPQWMMKYTQNVNQIFSDLVNCPLKPLK